MQLTGRMSRIAKRKLAVGAAGLAVLAGSGGAYAAAAGQTGSATKPTDRAAEQKAFLDDVATRLNVTRDKLDAAIKGAADARIDAAVAAGTLTKAQGDEAKKRLESGVPLLGRGLLGGKPGGAHGRPGGPGKRGFGFGAGIAGAADYLGLTEGKLRTQLHAGKSLADVATAQNKSVDGLKAALKTALTTRLDEAVKSGKLTDAQKAKILADLDTHLDDLVNGKRPAGAPGPGGRPHWR
jgi:hypothetical protein